MYFQDIFKANRRIRKVRYGYDIKKNKNYMSTKSTPKPK